MEKENSTAEDILASMPEGGSAQNILSSMPGQKATPQSSRRLEEGLHVGTNGRFLPNAQLPGTVNSQDNGDNGNN